MSDNNDFADNQPTLEEIDAFQKQKVAQKYDTGKPPVGLLSTTALEKIAQVMAHGARKYSTHQWRSGMEWQRLLDAALRHILAYNDGEDIDPESELSHLAHAGCCIMFLLEYERTHREFDNRYQVPSVEGPVEYSTYMGKSVQGLRLLGEPGESLEDTYARLYPHEEVKSHG